MKEPLFTNQTSRTQHTSEMHGRSHVRGVHVRGVHVGERRTRLKRHRLLHRHAWLVLLVVWGVGGKTRTTGDKLGSIGIEL